MKKVKKSRGNTLALVVVCIGLLAVLIAYFAINYNQLIGTNKEATSAIDAASLVAAKDMTRIVVDTPLGRVALVDDIPASFAPAGTTGNTTDARPILGINTIMGTLRLDAIIAGMITANNATKGNTTMIYLVNNDLTNAQNAMKLLSTTVTGACAGTTQATDKFGNAVTIQADVQNTYQSNNVRLGGTTQTNQTFTITPGYLVQSGATTATPVPQPASDDPTTKGQTYYQPYVNVPVTAGGLTLNFQFVPLSSQLALITADQFTTTNPSSQTNLPPTAVQVTTSQQVTAMSSTKTLNKTSGKVTTGAPQNVTVISTAECGANVLPQPTGTLAISFASGGIPAVNTAMGETSQGTGAGLPTTSSSSSSTSSTATSGGQTLTTTSTTTQAASPVDFTSPATIMNASMANVNSGAAAYSPWNTNSPGIWFKANGGPVPGSGAIAPYPYKDLSAQIDTNPSVALSFLCYDWLKSLALRPNIDSVVQALSQTNFYTLEASILGNSNKSDYPFPPGLTFNPNGSSQNLASNFIQPAYADATPTPSGTPSAFLDASFFNPKNDKRNQLNYNNNPEAYQRQQANVWGYVPADPVIPDHSRMVNIIDGKVLTSDGHPVGALYDLWNSLVTMAQVADDTRQAAFTVISARVKLLDSQNTAYQALAQQASQLEQQLSASGTLYTTPTSQAKQISAQLNSLNQQMSQAQKPILQQAMNQLPRAKAALFNASYCLTVTEAIVQNMKALSGIGCSEVNAQHFILAGSDLFPATQAATQASLADGSTGPCPDGQDPAAPYRDWCTPLQGTQSQLDFYKHASAPTIGARPESHVLLQPAYANASSSQSFYDKLQFGFHVVGGGGSDSTTGPGTGIVHLSVGQSPFAGESILKGQQLYQNVHALVQSATDTSVVTNAKGSQVAKTAVTTQTVWQVQARDEYVNLAQGNDYFADVNATKGYQTVTDTNWCNTSSTANNQVPLCPALVSEWTLTCPIPNTTCPNLGECTPPPLIFHPGYSTTSVSRSVSQQSGVMQTTQPGSICYSPLGFSTQAVAFYSQSYTTTRVDTTTTVTTYPGYWSMGNLDFYSGYNPPGAAWAGNGWSVTTSQYSYTTSSTTSTSTTTYGASQYLGESHS